MKAAIDIGTNTVRLAVADENRKIVLRKSKISRLGKGSNGYLQEGSIQRTIDILNEYQSIMQEYGCTDYIAVATSAVREAKNSQDFLKRTNLKVNVIDGLEEASLSQKGILFSLSYLKQKRFIAFDLGGGSCEFLFCDGENIIYSFSLNLGVVKLLEKYVKNDPPTQKSMEKAALEFKNELSAKKIDFDFEYLVGNAGTVTTLAAIDLGLVKYNYKAVENYELKRSNVFKLTNQFSRLTQQQRLDTYKVLEPGREDVILVGSKIVLTIMDTFDVESLLCTNGSLLEGLISKYF